MTKLFRIGILLNCLILLFGCQLVEEQYDYTKFVLILGEQEHPLADSLYIAKSLLPYNYQTITIDIPKNSPTVYLKFQEQYYNYQQVKIDSIVKQDEYEFKLQKYTDELELGTQLDGHFFDSKGDEANFASFPFKYVNGKEYEIHIITTSSFNNKRYIFPLIIRWI